MRPGRRTLKLWHRCFGIGAGLWLLLLAVTGCAISFYDELDRWLNPELRTVAVSGASDLRIDLALRRAGAALPGFSAKFIDLPNHAGESILFAGTANDAHGEKTAAQIFSDPRDGRLLGWRLGGALAFDRRHLMDTLYALHIDLMLGSTMAWFFGLVAMAWIIDHIAALPLAIPRLRGWRSAFRIGGHRLNLRRLLDLHRAPALWLFPVTLTLAVTGLCLSWQDDSRHLVSHLSPVSERLHYAMADAEPVSDPMSIDRTLARVRAATGRRIDSIQLLPAKGLYAFRAFDDRDLDSLGRLWIYTRMRDGRIVATRHDNGSSAGDAFFAWQYPLHSGKALGLAGQWIVFAGGIATTSLCVSGIALWLRRRPRARNVGK